MKNDPPSSNKIHAELKRFGEQLNLEPAQGKSAALQEAFRASEAHFNLVSKKIS